MNYVTVEVEIDLDDYREQIAGQLAAEEAEAKGRLLDQLRERITFGRSLEEAINEVFGENV